MKKLGTLHARTHDYLLLVKPVVKNPVKTVNATVYTSGMKRVGRVVDVIGNVEQPYIVVKPDDRDIVEELEENTTLYYHVVEKRRRRRPSGKSRRKGRGRRSRQR